MYGVTVYVVAGPPLGAVQLTVAVEFPGVALTPVTCPGAGCGVKETSTQ